MNHQSDFTTLPDTTGSYENTPEQSAEFARMALPLMTQYNITPTPQNFALWYKYTSGRDQVLCTEIDSLRASGREAFNEAVCLMLHEKHMTVADADSLDEISAHLHGLMSQAIDDLDSAESSVCASQETLSSQSKNIDDTLAEHPELQDALSLILQETANMAQLAHDLKTQLSQTDTEVEALRRELSEVKQSADHDTLTNLFTRRVFDDRLDAAVNHAKLTSAPLSIAFLDIDHFKNLNDTYGHRVGDKVIRFVSSLITQHVGASGITARYGGEEFAIVIPDTDIATATLMVNKIRLKLAESRLRRKADGEPLGQITLSAGVAEFVSGEISDSLVHRADAALHAAKQNGRNKVLRDDSEELQITSL